MWSTRARQVREHTKHVKQAKHASMQPYHLVDSVFDNRIFWVCYSRHEFFLIPNQLLCLPSHDSLQISVTIQINFHKVIEFEYRISNQIFIPVKNTNSNITNK